MSGMMKPIQPQGVETDMTVTAKEYPALTQPGSTFVEKIPAASLKKTLILTYVNDKGETVTEEYRQV